MCLLLDAIEESWVGEAGCLRVDRSMREKESSEGFGLWGTVGERKDVWEVGFDG